MRSIKSIGLLVAIVASIAAVGCTSPDRPWVTAQSQGLMQPTVPHTTTLVTTQATIRTDVEAFVRVDLPVEVGGFTHVNPDTGVNEWGWQVPVNEPVRVTVTANVTGGRTVQRIVTISVPTTIDIVLQ